VTIAELQWMRRLLLLLIAAIDRQLCAQGAPPSDRAARSR
jgi:hypothetical protein